MPAPFTHRERILAALEHREADHVPIDLGGTESSGIHADAYALLCGHLGVEDTPRIFDVCQQVTHIDQNLRGRFEIDTVPLVFEAAEYTDDTTPGGHAALTPTLWKPETAPDGSRVVRNDKGIVVLSMPPGGFYFDEVVHPLADISSPSDLASHKKLFDSFDLPGFADEGLDAMARRARSLHEGTDYCIVANLMVHVLAAGESLRGFENFMVDLVVDRPMAFALMERLLEAYTPRIESFAKKIAPHVDVILVNDDLGAQNGPLISPDTYRETVKKYHRLLWGQIKAITGKPLLLHSCGSIYQLIPDLIEIGVDAINPVQVSAADMDTAKLKREFGDDVTFWGGGCDTQNVLSRGTTSQVADEVHRRIDDLAPGGGFVFTQVHNIQPDVPPENIVAMLEAALEYGAY